MTEETEKTHSPLGGKVTLVGINNKATLEGENSTEVSFAKGGYEAHVTLSTVFVY